MANIGTLTAFLGLDTSDLGKAKVEMKQFTKDAEGQMNKAAASVNPLEKAFKRLAVGVLAYKAAQAAANAVVAAARYKTLGVVMNTVGRNAGFSAKQMEEFEMGLRKTGIAMTESRLNLTKMAQAQLDLNQSSKLARIAQNAAVIGNVNSSEAFSKLIHSIQTGRVAVLQTIGLNVSFGKSYKDMAKELGVTTAQLTDQQKAQARLNIVMKAGERIAGTYEAAMGTAGKKLLSLRRHVDDLQVVLGGTGETTLSAVIDEATIALKEFTTFVKDPEVQAGLKSMADDLAIVVHWMVVLEKLNTKVDVSKLRITGPAAAVGELSKFITEQAAAFTKKLRGAGPSEAEEISGLEAFHSAGDSFEVRAAEAILNERKLAEARAAIAFEANAAQLQTMKGTVVKEKENLKERLDNYTDYYADLQKQLDDNFEKEKENLKKLNSLYREQADLRKSTEALLAGLGKPSGRTAEEDFSLQRGELAQQLESAMALTGRDQIEALENYKQQVAEVAETFKDGFGAGEGAEIAVQAIEDIEAAYETQKTVLEGLLEQTNQQIEADRMWGTVLAEELDFAAGEIEVIQDLMKQLDQQIAQMDTLIELDINDLATAKVQSIQREVDGLRDKTITITTVHTDVFGDKGQTGTQLLDSFALGTNYVPQTGPYQLHQGEAVIPADQNKSSGGTSFGDINIRVDGSEGGVDWRQVVREQIKPELDNLTRN